ncbi:MAG TPA: SDR family oxidoreductase [Galbitalea sp.]|jgi:NAD(P)-dependent dehydrogenase (short-subunit alcohol dehydrogenase family)|nr:SDR family oxidoreductase [Galbitalea sp.]
MAPAQLTVVTGGSRGIGAAICARLADDGHDLVVGYRENSAAADSVVGVATATGGRAIALQIDTASPESVEGFFRAADEFGSVTGFVNNAAVSGPVGNLADANVDELHRALDVNLYGYLLCARRAIGSLSSGGAIVNISSAAATMGSPGVYVHYAAAKAAVDAMTMGLAKELAPAGIRVNAVAPGIVWSEFHLDPERPAKLASTIPFGRSGQPAEIAGAVSWLLSEDASYASGTVVRVAGGL